MYVKTIRASVKRAEGMTVTLRVPGRFFKSQILQFRSDLLKEQLKVLQELHRI